MTGNELLDLLRQAGKPFHVIGSAFGGVVAALACEGRLFTIVRGDVVSRVDRDALAGRNATPGYAPAGGDALWPAPEGTTLGYQYASGAWRVPAGLAGAVYKVTDSSAERATLEAEIDLVNNSGLGVPTRFRREVSVKRTDHGLVTRSVECIVCNGPWRRSREECLLAPWSLSQFDVAPGCDVVCPAASQESVWDLYEPSTAFRTTQGAEWRFQTEGHSRYQVGLGADVPWIELRLPHRKMHIRRWTEALPAGWEHVDIADASPTTPPSAHATRYSIYNGNTGFMEIEAVGGCPRILEPGAELRMVVMTEFIAGR